MSTLGENIKSYRKEAGLTQEELAEALGCAIITIRQYESGKREPKQEQLKKIAKKFNIPLYVLLDSTYHPGAIAEYNVPKRARFVDDTEMSQTPHFTVPSNSAPKMTPDHTTQFRHEYLIDQLSKGNQLTSEDTIFLEKYLENEVEKVGTIIAKYYSQLNETGKKEADKEINRTISQMKLLTMVPEYRKGTTENTEE